MPDRMDSSERVTLLERLAPGGAEDFITEVFCWILQQEGVGNAFLEFLKEQAQANRHGTITDTDIISIISGIKEGECSWSTQKSGRISGGVKRLDMICESGKQALISGKQALIFEHKAWARLHNDQLENYRQVGKKYAKSAIILITARPYQKEQDPDLHFLWRDVYFWLDEWLRERLPDNASNTDANDANLKFVCRNFLTLLEKRGLGPMPPIKARHFEAFGYMHDAKEGRQRIKELLNVVKDHGWPEIVQEAMKTDSGILDSPSLEDKWGRIGCSVLEGWRPGMFIGVLYDGRDHNVKLLDEKTSSDACVILDMHCTQYPEYRNNYHYKELVKRLTEKWPSDGSAAWQAYHHLDARNPNRWHPLHIRRKLADILLDGKSGEEQVDAFFEAVKEVVEFIVGLEEFRKLREDPARQDHANGE